MKTQKLIVIAAIVCLLVGASGAAMAEKKEDPNNKCPLGVVIGEVVIGDLTVGGDCLVSGAIIMGNVIVSNARTGVFVMYDVVVNGRVKVTGGSAVIYRSVVVGRNLVVEDTVDTIVEYTLVEAGNMRFVGNEQVLIHNNTVNSGNIRCVNNVGPSGQLGEYATQNRVPNGVITCFGQ